MSQVLTFDIGNAVTIEQFLGKHRELVPAIHDFDAYRRFSDTADATVVAAARTGDQEKFDAANEAFLESLHGSISEIEAMHKAGIQCNAR